MLVWLLIAIALAILGVIELLLNFTIPFVEYRTIILFLLILGMSYRIYNMERSGEKENMKSTRISVRGSSQGSTMVLVVKVSGSTRGANPMSLAMDTTSSSLSRVTPRVMSMSLVNRGSP